MSPAFLRLIANPSQLGSGLSEFMIVYVAMLQGFTRVLIAHRSRDWICQIEAQKSQHTSKTGLSLRGHRLNKTPQKPNQDHIEKKNRKPRKNKKK